MELVDDGENSTNSPPDQGDCTFDVSLALLNQLCYGRIDISLGREMCPMAVPQRVPGRGTGVPVSRPVRNCAVQWEHPPTRRFNGRTS